MTECKIEDCKNVTVGSGLCAKHWARNKRYGSPYTVTQIRGDDKVRFWSKVDKRSESECWNWVAKSLNQGYGYFRIGGRKGRYELAHRVAYRYTKGPIPKGEGYHGAVIMHTCDNRLCCNPSHLRLGTQSDNVRDMDKKGRRVTVCKAGEGHHMTTVTEQDIRDIRNSPLSGSVLGLKYGYSRSAINSIKRGDTWKHVN